MSEPVGVEVSALPRGLDQTFTVAAAELGMASASWLFARTVAEELGDGGVAALRDALGRPFPVLDAVCERWAAGQRAPVIDAAAAARACGGGRLVIVGLEALFLDALLPLLAGTRCAVLRASGLEVEWERVRSNLGEGVEVIELEAFQGWAGRGSVVLTFAYGAAGPRTHVVPAWLRAVGDDVRPQFRQLVAWDVLRAPMFVYPRWLVEVSTDSFTDVV